MHGVGAGMHLAIVHYMYIVHYLIQYICSMLLCLCGCVLKSGSSKLILFSECIVVCGLISVRVKGGIPPPPPSPSLALALNIAHYAMLVQHQPAG